MADIPSRYHGIRLPPADQERVAEVRRYLDKRFPYMAPHGFTDTVLFMLHRAHHAITSRSGRERRGNAG